LSGLIVRGILKPVDAEAAAWSEWHRAQCCIYGMRPGWGRSADLARGAEGSLPRCCLPGQRCARAATRPALGAIRRRLADARGRPGTVAVASLAELAASPTSAWRELVVGHFPLACLVSVPMLASLPAGGHAVGPARGGTRHSGCARASPLFLMV
jgi:hypothetical protein